MSGSFKKYAGQPASFRDYRPIYSQSETKERRCIDFPYPLPLIRLVRQDCMITENVGNVSMNYPTVIPFYKYNVLTIRPMALSV
jgi:hypothetical protein